MRIATNGVELEVEDEGRGPPVVLVMGIGATLLHWPEDLVRRLVGHGLRVIRMDNRDCGLSTRLEHLGKPPMRRRLAQALLGRKVRADYTLSDMAKDVAGVLDALDLPSAHVVGVSMGGMIAQTLAIEHADRVRSLVSMHSTPGERGHAGSLRALLALLGATPRTLEEAQTRIVGLFRVIGSPGFARDEVELRARVARVWERAPMTPGGFARQWAAVLASGSRTRRLADVRCPTLVIHGADDPLVPLTAGHATARAIPGAELHVYHGLGHDIPQGFVPTLAESIAEHARRAEARDAGVAPAPAPARVAG